MKKEVLAVLVIISGFALIQSVHIGQWGNKDVGPLLVQADDTTFAEKLSASGEWTLVKFWAPWCGACRRMMPTITQLAEDYGDGLTVLTVNVDEAPQTTQSFGVQPIPCLVLLHQEREVDRMVGVRSKTVLQAWIDGFRMRVGAGSL